MLKVICVGNTKNNELSYLIQDFSRRLGKYASFELISLKEDSSQEPEKRKEKEGKALLGRVKEGYLIALDERGKEFSSVELSKTLNKLQMEHKNITFVIGGAYGLSDEVGKKANLALALSKMTLTHEMALLFLTEQLYRAFTIMKNEPYHK